MDRITQPVPPAGSIVVGVDGSEGSYRALDWALERAHGTGQCLVLMNAVDPLTRDQSLWAAEAGVSQEVLVESAWSRGRELLGDAASYTAARCPGIDVLEVFHELDARTALLQAGLTAGLLVVGSRGRGPVASLLLGSVGVTLVRDAACPVVVARPRGEDLRQRSGVLVGIDEHEHSSATVETAFRMADALKTRLSVVRCVWDGAVAVGWTPMTVVDVGFEAAKWQLGQSVAGIQELYPDVPVHAVVVRGSVEDCLLDLAATSDLLVVGRHHDPVRDRVGLGSLGAALVERAHTTVMVVPGTTSVITPAEPRRPPVGAARSSGRGSAG